MAAKSIFNFGIAISICLFPVALSAQTQATQTDLVQTMERLDREVFNAYNTCNLASFEQYFSPRVEFYHDTGGATFDRRIVVNNTRRYICNKVRRELIEGTFKAYPIKDFGAISEGEHRFCQTSTGQCEGVAKFVMIWKLEGGRWRITRVLSYGHRAL